MRRARLRCDRTARPDRLDARLRQDKIVCTDRLAAVLACAFGGLLDQPADVRVEAVERVAGGIASRVLDQLTYFGADEQHLGRTWAARALSLFRFGHVVLLGSLYHPPPMPRTAANQFSRRRAAI